MLSERFADPWLSPRSLADIDEIIEISRDLVLNTQNAAIPKSFRTNSAIL